MFGRRKPLTLENRLAAASTVEIFGILSDNLRDAASFGRRPSVSVSEVDDICLVRSTDYETCIEVCRRLPAGERLKVARLWANQADAMLRIAAADMLGCENDLDDPALPEILDTISRLAADSDKAVVIAALDTFCLFQDRAGADVLGRIQNSCGQHPDRAIRWNFINAFPAASADDLSPLIRLTRDSESRIRAVACDKLGEAFQSANTGMKAAIRDALKARLNDGDGAIRYDVAQSLQIMGDLPMDPVVAEGLRIHTSVWGEDGRSLNMEALERLSPGELASMRSLENSRALAAVTAALEGDESDAAESFRTKGESDRRRAKANGLLSMDLAAAEQGLPPQGFEARIASATIVQLFEIIQTAARCLLVARHASRLAFEECHRRRDQEVRQAAENWAQTRNMGDKNNLHIVGLFLGNEAHETITRRLAGKAPLSRDAGVLIGQLTGSDEEAVIEALRGLGEHLRRPRDPALLKLMQVIEQHPNENIRIEYADLFENPETSAELATLLRLATDPAALVRSRACEGLANCKPETPEIREAIAALLEDEDLWLRRRAISILAGRGDSRVVDAVAAELQADEDTINEIVENDPVDLWEIIQAQPRTRYLNDLWRWQQELVAFRSEADFILKAIAACRAPAVPV